jgi:hypothetical protein
MAEENEAQSSSDDEPWECMQCRYDNPVWTGDGCHQCGRSRGFVPCPQCAPGRKRQKLGHRGGNHIKKRKVVGSVVRCCAAQRRGALNWPNSPRLQRAPDAHNP